MDATTVGGQKQAVPPVAVGSDAAASSVRAARRTPLADVDGAAAESGAGADEEDDAQVERFYALLANIRAIRGAYMTGGDADGGETDGSGARKRSRGAEPPWRLAFRLEDFEEASDAERATTKRRKDALPSRRPRPRHRSSSRERPQARRAVASPPPGAVAVKRCRSNKV